MSRVILEDPTSQLAHLLEQASRGEEVVILRDTTLVAKIVPVSNDNLTEGMPIISADPALDAYGAVHF